MSLDFYSAGRVTASWARLQQVCASFSWSPIPNQRCPSIDAGLAGFNTEHRSFMRVTGSIITYGP